MSIFGPELQLFFRRPKNDHFIVRRNNFYGEFSGVLRGDIFCRRNRRPDYPAGKNWGFLYLNFRRGLNSPRGKFSARGPITCLLLLHGTTPETSQECYSGPRGPTRKHTALFKYCVTASVHASHKPCA